MYCCFCRFLFWLDCLFFPFRKRLYIIGLTERFVLCVVDATAGGSVQQQLQQQHLLRVMLLLGLVFGACLSFWFCFRLAMAKAFVVGKIYKLTLEVFIER